MAPATGGGYAVQTITSPDAKAAPATLRGLKSGKHSPDAKAAPVAQKPKDNELEVNLIADYDTDMAVRYDEVTRCTQHEHILGYTLKKLIGEVKGAACLEEGCGNGKYMLHLHEQGASFVGGVDLSAECLAVAKTMHRDKGVATSKMSYTQADLSKPRLFNGNPFDVVISSCVICYSPNREALVGFLKTAHMNLKPGGRLVCINTRASLPADQRDELLRMTGIKYDIEPQASHSPVDFSWPTGWAGTTFFVHPDVVTSVMEEVGFTVQRMPLQVDPAYEGNVDLQRLAQLVPYDAFVCTKCDWLGKPKDDELEVNLIADYDTDMAVRYDEVTRCTQHEHILGYTLKKLIGEVKGVACLEEGCGNGKYMLHLHEQGASFVGGVDLSAECLAVAKTMHRDKGVATSKMSYTQADLSKPRLFMGHPFDVVISSCVICYSPNREALVGFLKTAHMNLKPGGRLVCINTRASLPADQRDELLRMTGIKYDIEPPASHSPVDFSWPNGWAGTTFFVHPDVVTSVMEEVGFTVQRMPLQVDSAYEGNVDLQRLAQLVPYDAFVCTTCH